jgi:hypothetical protein
MPLDKKYDGIALLNVFWDLSTTDFITGAAFEYVPNSYHFQLKKDDSKQEESKKDEPKKEEPKQ